MTDYLWKASFTSESHHRTFHECFWKTSFQVQNSDPLTALQERISCITSNTTTKSPPGPAAYGSGAAHVGNNSGTPSDKLAVAGWLGSHWASASSFAVSIFHRCSLVSSNFRIFFKWFPSCQLGTVQGDSLEDSAGWTNQRPLASLIWIGLDCLSLALRLAYPLLSRPVDFHPSPSSIFFVSAMITHCALIFPSLIPSPKLAPFMGRQWDGGKTTF